VSDADRERWDTRHAAVSGSVAMPPDALRGREALLPDSGRALDVACGRGAVAVWLALRGLIVDAVDVSRAGLAAGRVLAERSGVPERVRWWHHDLDGALPPGCDGPYDVVVCQRFRDPGLYPVLASRLGLPGLLVVTVLSEVDEEPGRWRAARGELLRVFGDLDVLAHEECRGEASILAARHPE